MTKTEIKAAQLVAARKLANALRDDVTRYKLRQFLDGNGKAYQWDYIDLEGNKKSHVGYAVKDATETVNVQLCEDESKCTEFVVGLEIAGVVPMAQDAFRTIDKSRVYHISEIN